MHRILSSTIPLFLLTALSGTVLGGKRDENEIPFVACPLIGAYYPPPTISKSSDTFAQLQSEFTKEFDDLVKNGGSEKFGKITPNTTSFSVVLFGGAESLKDDPVFFEYHYTSPKDLEDTNTNLTSTTKFPVGDVSMVFTVYAWLVEMGENWETPITKYLPELADTKESLTVPWDDVTIGALAGQMSGLSRESNACVIDKPCDLETFVETFADQRPYFLPDTTPVVSYAAFQLLAFAMQRDNGCKGGSWDKVLDNAILGPLNMTSSGVLGSDVDDIFAIDGFNTSQIGEPASLSFISTIEDLTRAGHAMLSSELVSPAVTRRWLHPNVATSNIRNGVGRPWEVYHSSGNDTVLDVLTKTGTIGQYASYFGLTTDFNAGFAILAHDSTVEDRKLDLNVYADEVSEALEHLGLFAAGELQQSLAGTYEGPDKNSVAAFDITKDTGYGLEVQKLTIDGVDMRAQVAEKLGIKLQDLDFRIYPSNVQDESKHQFVAVFQDKSAPVDMGTPTCITWQEVGADFGDVFNFVFELGEKGNGVGFELPQAKGSFKKTT